MNHTNYNSPAVAPIKFTSCRKIMACLENRETPGEIAPTNAQCPTTKTEMGFTKVENPSPTAPPAEHSNPKPVTPIIKKNKPKGNQKQVLPLHVQHEMLNNEFPALPPDHVIPVLTDAEMHKLIAATQSYEKERVLNTITALQKQLAEHQSVLDKLEEAQQLNDQLNLRNGTLEKERTGQDERISSLEHEVVELKLNLATEKSAGDHNRHFIMKLSSEVRKLKTENEELLKNGSKISNDGKMPKSRMMNGSLGRSFRSADCNRVIMMEDLHSELGESGGVPRSVDVVSNNENDNGGEEGEKIAKNKSNPKHQLCAWNVSDDEGEDDNSVTLGDKPILAQTFLMPMKTHSQSRLLKQSTRSENIVWSSSLSCRSVGSEESDSDSIMSDGFFGPELATKRRDSSSKRLRRPSAKLHRKHSSMIENGTRSIPPTQNHRKNVSVSMVETDSINNRSNVCWDKNDSEEVNDEQHHLGTNLFARMRIWSSHRNLGQQAKEGEA